LARESGHELVRITLSEQTDLADLFGQDLPVSQSSDSGGEDSALFVWADGVLLKVCLVAKFRWLRVSC
jgi:midasin